MKRKALGKGLSALLPEPDGGAPRQESQHEVPIDDLEPNPQQPRSRIEEAALRPLTESIRNNGLVQPILVRPRRAGRGFQIVAGERRWRAAREAGLATVPVTVREIPDDRLLELALIENIQREELSPLEEAQAFQRLQQELQLTQEQVAQRVSRDRSTVANTLRLLRAPQPVRLLLEQGRLEAGHVRALLALDDPAEQRALGAEAARRGWSVREVERRVAALKAPPPRSRTRRDPNTRAAEQRLRMALGTRVEISRRGRGGTLRIAFSDEAELSRLFEQLLRGSRSR